MQTRKRIAKYVKDWKTKGYPDDIPDEVPNELMRLSLAPSYKAIALALLNNDLGLTDLGFAPKKSKWYSYYKRIELEERAKNAKSSA